MPEYDRLDATRKPKHFWKRPRLCDQRRQPIWHDAQRRSRLLAVIATLNHATCVRQAFGPSKGEGDRRPTLDQDEGVAANPGRWGARGDLRLGFGNRPSYCAFFLSCLRQRRMASVACRARRSEGFSYARRFFISRSNPSRCIFFFKTRSACSTLLSRTKTCTFYPIWL